MYMPSLFFGGSSLIHLLASHPRVVALFGVGALVASLLQSPFGTPDVLGTAGYVQQLERVARQQHAIDPQLVVHARSSARGLAQLPTSRLTEIVGDTLRACGPACIAVSTSSVLKDRALLADVLLLHTLNQANAQRAAGRATAATTAVTELPQ